MRGLFKKAALLVIVAIFMSGFSGMHIFASESTSETIINLGKQAEQSLLSQGTDRFIDVSDDEAHFPWAKSQIENLAEMGIINGYDTGGGLFEFRPANNITRAEFVKLLAVAFEVVDETASSTFTDLYSGEWYYKYVASAQKEGLAAGNPDGTFNPESTITREEMFIFNARAINKYKFYPLLQQDEPEVAEILAGFTDVADISDWAKTFVATNIKHGLVTGSSVEGGMALYPTDPINRAEVAVVLDRTIKLPDFILASPTPASTATLTSAPTPAVTATATPTATPTTTPAPTQEPTQKPVPVSYIQLGSTIDISGTMYCRLYNSNFDILTDGILDSGEINQWSTNGANPEIVIDLGDGKDIGAISVVGSQNLNQSLFYRVYITYDLENWLGAGIDFDAAFASSLQQDGSYYIDFNDTGLVDGNPINEDETTFRTLKGAGANIQQPVVFKDIQKGVKQIKVVVYGNDTVLWYMYNSLTEITVYSDWTAKP